ncbi:hypothetical protein Msil_3099 [Methylocella silvestris BL2]|uniref:Uncharacterized protein n=1 Tax=Methylocella silvestris (strain DSM 15510 / CIP 108128 / LMG 27833 / NCIMB 13906 / BL2) TaxID=395965 RepID=B8EKY0_METSB|nr:hypothetical protein [Methylocella silvestris]ACK52008.1 hypothetical protein Msil_3099 [Methylocella silvestris BL2]
MERYPECKKLAARFEKMAAAGLLDVKFYVSDPHELTAEGLCADVNALYEAVDGGKAKLLSLEGCDK